MEWYERRPTDYKEDTWHLTLAEHGAYNLLLDHYYSNESPLPDQDRALASICNCSIEEWLEVKSAIMKFFIAKNGKLRNNKCDEIINISYRKRKDGTKRQAKYRKTLQKITRDKQPGDASTGQDSTGHNKEEKNKRKKEKLTIDKWAPNTNHYVIGAGEKYSNDEVDWLAEGFKDYAPTRKSKYKDFNLAFGNWLRGEISHRNIDQRRKSISGKSISSGLAKASSELASEIRQRESKQLETDQVRTEWGYEDSESDIIENDDHLFSDGIAD